MIILNIILFVGSIILTYLVRQLALKGNIIDKPNERSSHTIPTPRGGGLAIVIIWFIGISYLFVNKEINNNLYFSLLSGIIIVIVGIIDDVWSLKPGIRLFFQVSTAVLGLIFLAGLEKIDLGFFEFENVWILTPLAIIFIIWFINLFNFLDGIDGYIGSEIIFVFLAAFILFTDNIALLLAITTFGFIIWNWQPAKIFMGDVGSTLLGYNVAIFAIYYQNTDKSSIIIWLILSSVFWFDATLTLFRRWRNKEKLSQAHKKHAYQRIVQAGWSHQKTVLASIVINIVLFLLALIAIWNNILLLPVFFICVLFLYLIVKFIDRKKAFE